MNEKIAPESNYTQISNKINKIVFYGFLIRLSFLLLIFLLQNSLDMYLMEDDRKYEELAELYLIYANGPVDVRAYNRIFGGYLQKFWPIVMCTSAYLFNSIYVGRFINVFLSSITIKIIYKLSYELSENEQTALRAAKLFAFLPLPVVTACYPIKDIFLSFAAMYLFYIFVILRNGRRISILNIIFSAFLLICMYLTRGAIVELLLIFAFIYLIQRMFKQKKYLLAFATLIAGIVLLFVLGDVVMASFSIKIEDYSDYANLGEGIQLLMIHNLSELYKLPATYLWATLQPIRLHLFNEIDVTWQSLLPIFNISVYPIAMGNFLYIFVKKHNFFYWLSTFAMYSAIIILSLGIYRHYLFLFPVIIINYSLYRENNIRQRTMYVWLLSLALLFAIITMSL